MTDKKVGTASGNNQGTIDVAFDVLQRATDPTHIRSIGSSLERNTTGELQAQVTEILNGKVDEMREKLLDIVKPHITPDTNPADTAQMDSSESTITAPRENS